MKDKPGSEKRRPAGEAGGGWLAWLGALFGVGDPGQADGNDGGASDGPADTGAADAGGADGGGGGD